MKHNEESQTVEFKREFNFKKIKRELSGLLNCAKEGTKVFLYVGVDDNTCSLYPGYIKKDPSEAQDLILGFLQTFEVECKEPVSLSNGGFMIEALANRRVVLTEKKVYSRTGTTTSVIDANKYHSILKLKELNLEAATNEFFDRTNFLKLEKFMVRHKINSSLLDFLINAFAVVVFGNKKYLTNLASFIKDDSNLVIKIGDSVVKGPIFDLYETAIEEVFAFAKTKMILQKNNITRRTMVDSDPRSLEILREMVSNLFAHSHFKLLSNDPQMEIKFDEGSVSFSNRHTDDKLMNKIKNRAVPHKAHNPMVFSLLRFLTLTEGKRIGFEIFFKNGDKVDYEVSSSDFLITYKGE